MSADQQLRDRLERAASFVDVDAERRLELVHGTVARKDRSRRARALGVAAAVTAVVVVLAWQLRPIGDGPIQPAGIPAGRIGYLGAQGSHRGLFELNVATGDVAALSADSESVLWAAWSPDGSQVAYIVEEPGPLYAIVVADADGSHPAKILEEEDAGAAGPDLVDLSWSPDGSKIAYSGRTVEDGVARRTILIVDADGSGEPVVLNGLWASVSWSPNGERLLLSGFPADEGRFDLYTVRPDGSQLVQLTDDEVAEHEPSWSPEGTRIVFAMGGSYFQDVYVMNADGSDVRRLTDWEGLDLVPVWSPDGRWIAFASDRDATPAQQEGNRSGDAIFTGLSLYVMGADGSDVRVLLEGDSVLPVTWKA